MFHPGFRNHYNYHDVAVMVMKENFILDRHINTICMPNQKDISEFISFDNCFATGWGKDKFGAKGDSFLLCHKKTDFTLKFVFYVNILTLTNRTGVFLGQSWTGEGGSY